ncbi:MAG TPA: 16S rRNA (cytidine(1402)-2'-O)-methyltransferase, partial [Terrimesophilobacter sp.]|nr:16S rRNA (cytidine(1402)-2'-O)-methyltransferase [Terrimesophilobacter sp.]
ELTKLHEEVRRGTATELAQWAEGGVKGELVLVIEGAAEASADPDAALAQVLELVAGGTRLKDAAATVSMQTGLSQRDLYEGALAAKQGNTRE